MVGRADRVFAAESPCVHLPRGAAAGSWGATYREAVTTGGPAWRVLGGLVTGAAAVSGRLGAASWPSCGLVHVAQASTRATRRDVDGGSDEAETPFIGPGTWGEPDLVPPSMSASARAETAELEALWELPPRRADSGHT